jgi:hypothetical protein
MAAVEIGLRSYHTYPNETERLDFIRRSVEAGNSELEIYAKYAFDHLREAHSLLHKGILLTKGKLSWLKFLVVTMTALLFRACQADYSSYSSFYSSSIVCCDTLGLWDFEGNLVRQWRDLEKIFNTRRNCYEGGAYRQIIRTSSRAKP